MTKNRIKGNIFSFVGKRKPKAKPWYKKWWGILIAIIFFFIFIPWYFWKNSKIKTGWKGVITLVVSIIIIDASMLGAFYYYQTNGVPPSSESSNNSRPNGQKDPDGSEVDGSDPEQNGQEPQGSDGTDGQENPGVSNGQSEPGNADGSSNPPGAPSLPEAEVIAVFRNYLDERAEARVIMAMAVSEITYRNRIVRVTFDPTLVDLDNELFRLISPFQNLAEFVCIPIVSNDDVGTRVRPVIDAIETVLPDGSSLGRLTAQEIDAKVTNVSASKTMRIHDTNRTAAINALEKRLIARSKYRLQVACIDNQRELTTAILVVHHR